MYKFLRATLWTVVLMLFGSTVAFCATTDFGNVGEPSYKLVHTLDSSEVFVATYDVTDYGAVADGQTDNTNVFQKLLNKVGDLGGGIVYVPSGRYAIKGALSIPKGVTLRGDWQKPSRNNSAPIGTLLMAYTGRNGNERTTPFVEMAPETGIMDLTIWYPEQDPNNITPYSPTIRYGFNNYFGNEYCNTKNVTLLNSYIGVLFNYDNGGASPVVNGLYGTTLCKAIEIDKIADVGRIENVNLSPDYWKNSGVANAPTTTSFNDYMYNNSIGIVMRRNDWSYTCNININGYNIGYDTEKTLSTDDNATPNGHHYNFDLSECKTGIQINATNSVGILFDEINIHNCENGIVLGENTSDAAQFTKTTVDVSKYAIQIPDTSSTKLTFNSSKVSRGRVAINSGTFVANNTTFSNSTPQIYYGTSGRGNITECAFTKGQKITNKSVYESTLSDSTAVTGEVSDFTKVEYDPHTPARTVLYNATVSPYNASTGSNDNTSAIQEALNQASNDGGGIVFLPSGKYKVRGHLTIPSNVELRGAVDLWSVPHGSGTILEAYENRNNPDGDSFIQLKADSGIRGIVVDYPEQVFSGSADWLPAKYPYTIQGQGANVYVIDSGVRAAYKALDLFTYKCDNHYVDFLGGHAFDTGVRVGGNSVDGKLYNLMFNVIVYACGNESKFGSFSNMPNGVSNAPLYSYGLEHLDFLILGDCDNETLYNDFHYGSYRGTLLQNDGNGGPSGRSMGLGVDGSTRAVYWTSGLTKSFDFDNSQIVSIGDNNPKTAYFYSEENSNFKSTFNNCDFWGQPQRGLILNSGNLTLYGSHFNNPGQQTLASVSNASLNILASASNQNGTAFVDSGSEKNISISGSILNNRNNNADSFKSFDNNMGLGSTVSSSGALAQVSGRDSWKATACNNNNNAKNALDGNAATRWDTSGSQTPGQWFMVDFGKTLTYNTIICDVGLSTSSDAPAAYEIYVSSNGTNWGNAIASGTTTNGIIKVNVQNSRYVRVVQTGSKSNYWSIHEFYVLNAAANNDLISDEDESKTPEETTTEETTKPQETTTVEPTTKPEETTTVEPTTKPEETTTVELKGEFISSDVKVIGYQISAVLRGSRVLYSSESTIKGQEVVSSGLIYGFANGPITKDDVVLNSSNKYIASYEATSKGIIANYNGDSATAIYYARTMTHNGYGAARYNAKYYVRAYSVLENGAIAYSEVYDFSLYSIADTLYKNNLMPTYDGHQYLFYNILTVVDPDYKEIPYKWENTVNK